MKAKRITRVVLVLAFAVVLLSYCGCSLLAAPRTLKYACVTGAQTNAGRFGAMFCQKVNEKAAGKLVIEFYPGGQLGTLDELIAGAKMGTIEIVATDFTGFETIFPDLAVFQFPYVFRDVQHADKVTSPGSPLFEKLNERFVKETGIRMIGNLYYGTRLLTCNSPIRTPADLKGKKIRVLPRALWVAMVKGMGAIPTPVEFSELPTALITGMVDGQENPAATIWSSKLYQMQKYLMLTDHMICFAVVTINNRVWNSLNQEQRDIIMEAWRETKEYQLQQALKEESDLIAKLKAEGMTVIGPADGLDIGAFRNSVFDYCVKEFPQWAGYIKEIQAIE